MAGNYADDFDRPSKVENHVDDTAKKALSDIAVILSGEKEPDDLQNDIYQVAKNNGIQPKDLFKILYQILLASDSGPKLGPFMLDIGRGKAAAAINEHI